MGHSVGAKLGLERREMLHQQCCQETIFSKREKILLVERVDIGLGVFFDNAVGDDDGSTFVCGSDTIESETARKTGDRSKERLESLGQMVGDVVLVHLNHGPPRAFFVRKLGFAAYADDLGVVRAGGNEAIKGLGCNGLPKMSVLCNGASREETYRVRIDREDVFVERRINPNDIPHLMVNFQLKWGHR